MRLFLEKTSQFLEHFHGITPKPIDVPESLFYFAKRHIFNGGNMGLENLSGNWFVKSNDKIKSLTEMIENPRIIDVPAEGNYQISKYISIESEWRVFVYNGKMQGLQHYVGEFTLFPDVEEIKTMIEMYKDAPIAYTLDVGINYNGTFVIEVHDFFSCGLYGFADHSKLPSMFNRWFNEYVTKNGH